MSDEDLSMKATLDATQALREANKLTNAIADLNQATGHTDKNLQAAERNLVASAAAMRKYAKATEDAARAQARFRSNTNLKNFSVFGKAQDPAIAAQVPKSSSFYSARSSFQPDAYNAAIEAQRRTIEAQQRFHLENQRAANASAAANLRVQKSFEGMASARYALYDVSRVLGLISVASLGAAGSAIKLEASYESLLVQVKRTSQATGAEWQRLRTDLIDLTTDIPATIEDVSAIATLGGQLGIAAEDIDSFTESVIKFSATTNVSATAAAESLGRVAQLSGVDSSQYDQLAASIYQVGITSISTEADILAVAQQIAVSANSAGFAADQTIALASALASLGVAPERARGSIQRIFNVIENSVADGGEMLDQFASLSGTTADKFAADWNGDPQKAFQDFLAGLGRAEAAGGNINNILSDLGINAVRDTDALKRLAQNTDVYAKAISEASEGWRDGSVFAEGYAEVADTLDSKLTTLSNTLKAILEAAQDNTALKKFVDLLQAVANVALAIARSPLGSAFTALALTIGVLVGSFALLGAGAAAAYASLLAMVTAMSFMTKETVAGVGAFRLFQIALLQVTGAAKGLTAAEIEAGLANKTLSTSLLATGESAVFAGTAMKAFKATLLTTGAGIALVALGEVVSSLYSQSEKTRLAAEQLQDAFSSSLAEDTANADFSVRGLSRTLEDANASTQALEDSVRNSALTFSGLTVEADNTKGKLEEVVVAMGAVTEQAVRNNLADLLLGGGAFGEDLDKQQQYMDRVVAGLQSTGYSMDQITQAVLNNDVEMLKEIENAAIASQYALQEAAGGANVLNTEAGQTNATLVSFIDQVLNSTSALDRAAQAALLSSQAHDESGAAALAAADSYEEEAAAVVNLADGLFDVVNAQAAITQSAFDLGGALQQNGNDFTTFTEGGRANIAALSQAVSNAAQFAGEDTALFASLVEQIVSQLEAAGATGVRQISAVRAALSSGTTTSSSNSKALAILTGQVASGYRKAAEESAKVAKNTGSAVKQVRTLKDYVSDLSRVFQDSFDFRFGFQQAEDDSSAAFRDLVETFDDAKKKARDLENEILSLNATISGLGADRNVLTYQLSVAREYGDSLREKEILSALEKNTADVAKAQADMTDASEELQDQQGYLTRNLSGTSKASEDQRKKVLALISAYQGQIVAYAKTGASQKEVAAYSEALRARFQDQATTLGYTRDQVEKYSSAFTDFTTIVNAVPRNLTVRTNANTDPARAALDEFFAQYQNRSVSVTTSVSNPGTTRAMKELEISSNIIEAYARLNSPGIKGNYNAISAINSAIASWTKQLVTGAYAKGGRAPKGWALVGEEGPELVKFDSPGFVYTAPQTQQMLDSAHSGRNVAPALMAGSSGRGIGGGGTVMVELSPTDRNLLAAAGNVDVLLDGKSIVKFMDGANESRSRRGVRG